MLPTKGAGDQVASDVEDAPNRVDVLDVDTVTVIVQADVAVGVRRHDGPQAQVNVVLFGQARLANDGGGGRSKKPARRLQSAVGSGSVGILAAHIRLHPERNLPVGAPGRRRGACGHLAQRR